MCCIDKLDESMKRFVFVAMACLQIAQGCVRTESALDEETEVAEGRMSVMLKCESPTGKSLDDYDLVLSEEVLVKDVQVLVFDRTTGALERSVELGSIDGECVFKISVGVKDICALINGPDVSRVRSMAEFLRLKDSLSERNYRQDGFVMMGSSVSEVKAGMIAQSQVIVRRLVSRVVLRSVTCNVASQYGGMTVDCVFLGNASVEYSLGGEVLRWANAGGYADPDKTHPVGIDGVEGMCPDYLFRAMDRYVEVGQRYEQPVYLYCYPNETSDYTCLYILATIGEGKYYYRVPLDKGLASNYSCAVDVAITNLGSALPPDGELSKGEIKADIYIDDWSMGYLYNAEF